MTKQIDIPYIGGAHYEAYYLGDGRVINTRLLDDYTREQLELAQKKPIS